MSGGAPYRVRCSCGTEIPVETAAAGGTKLCSCGQTVPVPRLSELKRLAGHAPEAIRPSDQIRHLLLHGGLPPDPIC